MSLTPNHDVIAAHLDHLIGHLKPKEDAQVEIAWCKPPFTQNGKLAAPVNQAKLFWLNERDEMADFAVQTNRTRGQNVYVGPSLRNKDANPNHRAKTDPDYLASPSIFADCDEPGVLERAEKLCREWGVPPTARGITGRHPHVRGQLWWRLDELLRDPATHKELTGKMARVLGSDLAVSDPCRVMRLCGTVAWPVKAGRVEEMTEFTLLAAA